MIPHVQTAPNNNRTSILDMLKEKNKAISINGKPIKIDLSYPGHNQDNTLSGGPRKNWKNYEDKIRDKNKSFLDV